MAQTKPTTTKTSLPTTITTTTTKLPTTEPTIIETFPTIIAENQVPILQTELPIIPTIPEIPVTQMIVHPILQSIPIVNPISQLKEITYNEPKMDITESLPEFNTAPEIVTPELIANDKLPKLITSTESVEHLPEVIKTINENVFGSPSELVIPELTSTTEKNDFNIPELLNGSVNSEFIPTTSPELIEESVFASEGSTNANINSNNFPVTLDYQAYSEDSVSSIASIS